jgi:L-asparaginase II
MHSKPIKAVDTDRSVPVANYREQTRFPKNHIVRTQHRATIASKHEEGRVRSSIFLKKRTFYGSACRSCRALLTLCQSSTQEEGDHYPRDLINESSSVSIDEVPSRHGTLKIAPLEKGDIGAASVVLTRSFATSPQGMVIDDVR